MLTYLQAIILGIVQGVTELFPVSSLGHSVLIANLFGWHNLGSQETAKSSTFLNLLVMMHVATALALIIFYRSEWVRIARGFFRSLKAKDPAVDSDAKLAWLLIAATIPAGLIGLIFEHKLRAAFGTAFFAIVFIIINGVMLIKGDTLVAKAELARPRRRRSSEEAADELSVAKTGRVVSDHLTFGRAILIGVAQIGALFAGISRSGITMLAGLRSGLEHQDAARFSFLLATPIILAAGVYKLPSVLSTHGDLGPIAVGSALAGIGAYVSVRFLDKYFRGRSLKPFGWYCIGFGVFMIIVSIIHGAN